LRSIYGTENSSQQMSLQCLSTFNIVFSDEGKILIKSLYLKGYTAKRLTDKFSDKYWTKHGVDKLLKHCGTQIQFTDGQKFEFLIFQGSVTTRLR